MHIAILTDLEGISGVCIFDQTRDKTTVYYQEARRLLMGDIAACVDGCLEGGATDIAVMDFHGASFNIVPEMMHPQAQYLTGRRSPTFAQMEPFYRAFDAAILLGAHAMAGTPDGILCHTQSSLGGNRYWYNGREFGEIGQQAAVLGEFGVPIIMVTGDVAGCREGVEFLGPEIVQVATKIGFAQQYGLLLAPAAAHERIRAGAREAMSRIATARPFVMEPPIQGRLVYPDKTTADNARPVRARRVDDHTFEATFERACQVMEF